MKQIFDERKSIGTFEKATAYILRNRYSKQWGTDRQIISVYGYVKAHFDKDTNTLVIDFTSSDSHEYETYTPESKRLFETQYTREAAIRSVITHADAWYAEILASIPLSDASLSDDEVIERHKAKERATDVESEIEAQIVSAMIASEDMPF